MKRKNLFQYRTNNSILIYVTTWTFCFQKVLRSTISIIIFLLSFFYYTFTVSFFLSWLKLCRFTEFAYHVTRFIPTIDSKEFLIVGLANNIFRPECPHYCSVPFLMGRSILGEALIFKLTMRDKFFVKVPARVVKKKSRLTCRLLRGLLLTGINNYFMEESLQWYW